MRKSYIIAPLVLLVLAAASATAESVFYGGRLDQNNVVQESFFLPLTFILIALALISFVVLGARQWFKK